LRLLEEWAEDRDNSIIITSGFIPEDSPLKAAKDQGQFKTDEGEFDVKAEVRQIELSGHADQTELIHIVSKIKPKRTLLVHGDLEQAELLAEKIGEMTDVKIPEANEVIDV
jgi:Cft2 family RNA processing exonuclease